MNPTIELRQKLMRIAPLQEKVKMCEEQISKLQNISQTSATIELKGPWGDGLYSIHRDLSKSICDLIIADIKIGLESAEEQLKKELGITN